jgi:hypothetical protein
MDGAEDEVVEVEGAGVFEDFLVERVDLGGGDLGLAGGEFGVLLGGR